MNDRMHETQQDYLRSLARAMLLADWEIILDRSRSDAETWAQIEIKKDRNMATIYLGWPEYFDRSREDQRETLVHELLHIHLDRVDRIVKRSEREMTFFAQELHAAEMEIATHTLARILSPNLPLPPEAS